MKEKITFFLLDKIRQNLNTKANVFFLKFASLILLAALILLPTMFCIGKERPTNSKEQKNGNNFNAKNYRELIIKFKAGDEIYRFKYEPEADLSFLVVEYQRNQNIDFVEKNVIYRSAILPSDTYYSNQWYLQKIKAPEAWDISRESPNIVIAVIDSGVQINHVDLKDNIWINKKEIPNNNIDDDMNGFVDDIHGWDFVYNDSDPGPKFKKGYKKEEIIHGTIVAGVIAASGNNATGISGITWKVQIMPLKVLSDDGKGDTYSVTKAIDYAVANNADIINLSFVASHYSRALEAAIRRAYEAGVIIVAASGNDENGGNGVDLDKTPLYPVCYDGYNGENMVIGVAATDALDQKASFSGYGSKCIDISAPGVSVFSTVVYSPQNYYNGSPFDKNYDGYWSGTSMAVPMISGALALIEGLNPGLDRDAVVNILLNNANSISRLNPDFFGKLGKGRLNVQKSLLAAKQQLVNKTYDLVIAPASNGFGHQVAVTEKNGNLKKQFLAYDKNFRGGVNVAAGDVDGDGQDEIITGVSSGGGPQVKIFSGLGALKSQFFAYDKNFRGGVNVAVADVDGGARNKKAEIITAPGQGGGPHIIIFNNYAQKVGQFFAYDKNFRGGVNVYGGDVDNDGLEEIITGAGPGGAPHVRIFKKDGTLIHSFYSLNKDFSGGVKVGVIKY